MNENVIRARKAVQSLFSSPTTLQINATDYHVDRAAKLVACISDPIHKKEKLCLLEQVKLAKRLSRARNLLNYGDFESPEWSGENGWKASTHVVVQSDHPILTGRYLYLPGAYQTQLSDRIFPTYAYQKIEESKLKPYTRYSVRAFIGSSKDLEVFATRYDKEVHKTLHVPEDRMPTNPCTGEYLVEPDSHPMMANPIIPQNLSYDSCGDDSYRVRQQTSVVCADPHEWQCHIDTGELDMIQNLGIWVGFKIGTTDGMATIDHVEVIEVGPLTGEALTRMKKREQRWQKKWAEKQMRIEKAVQAAREAIQALFTDANQNRLQSAITLKQILKAETWVKQIPYIYNPFLVRVIPVVPGETYDIFQELSSTVAIARALYTRRNLLRNGDFTAGLAYWNVTEGAEVQQLGNISVLKLSDWSATVSQHVCVEPEHSYLLRVTARKEDVGEGYVTISDGTGNNTETLQFTVGEEMTSGATATNGFNSLQLYHESYGTSSSIETNGRNGYANEPAAGFGFTPYGDENSRRGYTSSPYEMNTYPDTTNIPMKQGTDCGCGCNTNDETNLYSNNITNQQGVGCGCYDRSDDYPIMNPNTPDLSGYITKTVEIFPETKHVCIEIGETEGIFQVASIELIRMNCE
ncbi:hypothetical protein CUC43_32165 (plasmid) [Bacillus thuringiensis LM1212]|uniref:hypothetical protein n=1 Tax=Bacillus cereus group TaxID=86661 RepID=UPI0004110BA7|nr:MULTISPECIES: hypothetical protein [Bacillus cereus group]AXY11180.1 hypothetical protein CUC43_31335 [Bacillus thuringiensis LM1212]AXY11291.1 hypothetical protein CUC43_32165 [Bacillus thuringiensis LM1212]QDF27194.1 hypothetical protein FJR70_30770 [Bacillus tropicus]QUG99116.1 hypothetical protein HCM98_30175 [Bacillus tropicus]